MALVSPADCASSVSSSACSVLMRACSEPLSESLPVRRRIRPLSSGDRSETEFMSRSAR